MKKDVEVKDNIYSKVLTQCPLCKNNIINSLYNIDKYDPPFKVDRCRNCSFIFMNPRFNDKIIKSFYTKDYFEGNSNYIYYDERDAEKFSMYVWEKRIKKIRTFISSGNFLDIGSAFGGFLKAASLYYAPYGIEISEYAGSYSRKLFGKNIHIGEIEDHPFKKNFFSVISMIEVLEHLKDPVSALAECYSLLKSDGILLLQTANFDGLQAKIYGRRYAYFMPGHLSYFTKKNLEILLKNIGFRKVKVFFPVEFGLLPKLLKSRYFFKTSFDYFKWIRIIFYHYLGKIHFRSFSMTSSMVIYAIK